MNLQNMFFLANKGPVDPREVGSVIERDGEDRGWSRDAGEAAERRTIESRQNGIEIGGNEEQGANGKRTHGQRTKKSQRRIR